MRLPLVFAFLLALVLPGSSAAHAQATVLTRDQAGAIMPATVFYRGRTATIQARNSAGLKLPGDVYVLAATVDTAGYSTSIQESYQAYLLTEVSLEIGGKTVPPGAYGFGFTAGDRFTILDLGGHPILSATSSKDAAMTRPNPLQIVADPSVPGHFRLYSGRSFVPLSASSR